MEDFDHEKHLLHCPTRFQQYNSFGAKGSVIFHYVLIMLCSVSLLSLAQGWKYAQVLLSPIVTYCRDRCKLGVAEALPAAERDALSVEGRTRVTKGEYMSYLYCSMLGCT